MAGAWIWPTIVLTVAAFLICATLLLLLSLLALCALGVGRLESSIGILRDGLPRGESAPAWSLSDLDGRAHGTPSGELWQLLIFADHSIKEFEALTTALGKLLAANLDTEAIMLARGNGSLARAVLDERGLELPVVQVTDDFYHLYRMRVMPFLVVADPRGVIRALGLANSEATLTTIWRKARLEPLNDAVIAGAPL